MAGPALSVLSPEVVEQDDPRIEQLVDAVASAKQRTTSGVEFWVTDMAAAGRNAKEFDLPFSIELGKPSEGLSDEELRKIEAILVWRPKSELAIIAHTTRGNSALMIASLALRALEIFHGVCIVTESMLPMNSLRADTVSADERRAAERAYVTSVGGMAAEITYEVDHGRAASYYLVDAKFLRRWVARDDFHYR